MQAIVGNQVHQQHLAAASMLPGMSGLGSMAAMNNPAAAAAAAAMAMNPMAAMAAAAGMKQEDAMNATALFNNFLKNSGTNLSSGIMPGLASGIPPTSIGGNGALAPGLPGTSSASVPPLGAGIDETAARLSASVNSTRAASASRPRSSAGSPSISKFFFFCYLIFINYLNFVDNLNSSLRSGTPLLKRTKVELDEVDGELEIDVQNDDATGGTSSGFHGLNGNSITNHPSTSRNKDGGRESTQSATSSRDSPRSGKQVIILFIICLSFINKIKFFSNFIL